MVAMIDSWQNHPTVILATLLYASLLLLTTAATYKLNRFRNTVNLAKTIIIVRILPHPCPRLAHISSNPTQDLPRRQQPLFITRR